MSFLTLTHWIAMPAGQTNVARQREQLNRAGIQVTGYDHSNNRVVGCWLPGGGVPLIALALNLENGLETP